MQTPDAVAMESAIWGRLLEPPDAILSVEAARAILRIEFPQSDRDRMRVLAEKARTGALTPKEQMEIDAYGRIGSFISIMKSKARMALRKAEGNGAAF